MNARYLMDRFMSGYLPTYYCADIATFIETRGPTWPVFGCSEAVLLEHLI